MIYRYCCIENNTLATVIFYHFTFFPYYFHQNFLRLLRLPSLTYFISPASTPPYSSPTTPNSAYPPRRIYPCPSCKSYPSFGRIPNARHARSNRPHSTLPLPVDTFAISTLVRIPRPFGGLPRSRARKGEGIVGWFLFCSLGNMVGITVGETACRVG